MSKFYRVVAERAHIGRGNTATITFYYKTNSAISAMNKAKRQRGTKRSKIPLEIKEVSEEEYNQNIGVSAYVRSGVRSP